MTTQELRAAAEKHLRALAGEHARLREDQWTAIRALVAEKRRALVVQRTGWGKSAVYFVATALLRAAGAGPTVIVSPLLALMRNQVDAAARAGIHARTINSANLQDWEQVYAEVRGRRGGRPARQPRAAQQPGVPRQRAAAPDRGGGPHRHRRGALHLRLGSRLPARLPPDQALLETLPRHARARHYRDRERPGHHGRRGAVEVVVRDAGDSRGAEDGEVLVLRGPLDRESLRLAVVSLPAAPMRLAWLAASLSSGALPNSGIIYTLTVAAAYETAAFLREQGIEVTAYSGKDDQARRLQAEDDLLANRVKALVATSALGMGFDKPDLGFVVHLGAPQSPVAYYQQIGRAGRGVERAEVVLLPGLEDRDIWAYFASLAFPRERPGSRDARRPRRRGQAVVHHRARDPGRPVQGPPGVHAQGARRRRRGGPHRGGWAATGQPWAYDGERYERVAQRAHQGAAGDARLPGHRRVPDGVSPPRARRPRGGAVRPVRQLHGRALAAQTCRAPRAEAAGSGLRRPGVTVEPRKMWPTGMKDLGIDASGKIPATR